jgi:hypothetical protein
MTADNTNQVRRAQPARLPAEKEPMKKRYISVGFGAILLGVAGGGLVGYRTGYGAGMTRGKEAGQAERATMCSKCLHDVPSNEAKGQQPSMDAAFRNNIFASVRLEDCSLPEFIAYLQCRSVENNPESGGIQIAIGHPLAHSPDFNDVRFTFKATNVSVIEILDTLTEQTGITYSIRPCAVLWEKKEKKAEPTGAGQPSNPSKDAAPVKDQTPTQPSKDGPR